MTTLFPDQKAIKSELYARFAKGARRPLIVAPTGWGKGTVAGDIIREAVMQGKRVWFIVNRKPLVHDMVGRLRALDINPGVLMGDKTRGTHLNVIVASVDTLRNRMEGLRLPDLAFIDEAHMFLSAEAKKLILGLSKVGVKIVHTTATPWCLNRKGLGEIADTMIEGPQADLLISTGRLAVPVVYAPSVADMGGVRVTSTGEFDEDEAAAVMSTKKLVGDLVKHWKELASGRKTVGFAINRKTAHEYSDAFNAAGIPSLVVDGNTPDGDANKPEPGTREYAWAELRAGRTMVWSVGIISYGWDVKEVDCIILARPTMSLALHLQQCGRGLRACPGKKDCLILDHAGNTIRDYGDGHNGMPDSHREWTLRGRKRAGSAAAKVTALPQVCPECSAVSPAGTPVCACGYKFANFSGGGSGNGGSGRKIEIDEAGTLQRVESRVYIYPDTTGDVSRDALIGQATARGYHPGWIDHRMKALEIARKAYRETFNGEEPKAHWNGAQLNAMIENEAKSTVKGAALNPR